MIPQPAIDLGYNQQLFFDDFNSPSTIDLSISNNPGFNWYIGNFGTFQGTTLSPSNPAWYSLSNSILTLSSGTGDGGGNCTKGFFGSGPQVVGGHLFDGSKGFYVEGLMKFPLPPTNGNTPNFWLEDLTGLISQINNVIGVHFGEIDIFECNTISVNTQVFDWHADGTRQGHSSGASLGGMDFSVFHRWGFALVPTTRNAGTGIARWFVDGSKVGSDVTWVSSDSLAIMESGQYTLQFSNTPNQNFQVDSIGVWGPATIINTPPPRNDGRDIIMYPRRW